MALCVWRVLVSAMKVLGLGIVARLRGKCLVGIGNVVNAFQAGEGVERAVYSDERWRWKHIVRESGVTVNVAVTLWSFAAE
jgi:hypothetical protein